MENVVIFSILFVIIFAICFGVYYKHYDKFVKYHPYSLAVDILVFIATTICIIIFFLYYDAIPKYNYLLWIQVVFAMCSLNIHLTRFFIGITRKRS